MKWTWLCSAWLSQEKLISNTDTTIPKSAVSIWYGCSPTNSDSAANETHLEMVEFYDYCPVYSFTVKKIEGSTGYELSFDSTQALIEPEGQIAGLMTSVDTTIYDAADPKTTGPELLQFLLP